MKRLIVITFLVFGVAVAASNKSTKSPSTTPPNMGASSMYSDQRQAEEADPMRDSTYRARKMPKNSGDASRVPSTSGANPGTGPMPTPSPR